MKLFHRADSESIKKTIKIYKKVAKDERKSLLMGSVFIPLQQLTYMVLLPFLISIYVQILITEPHNTRMQLWLVAGMIILGILSVISSRIGFFALFNHQERMTTKLSEYAVNKTLSHSQSFFSNSKVGALAGDINSFSRSYIGLLDTIFLQASGVVVNFLCSLLIVAFIAPIMLPALLILTLSVVGMALYSYNKRGDLRAERKELQSELMGMFGDVIGNQTLVRMFSRQKGEVARITQKRHEIEKVARKEIVILENSAELRVGVLVAFQIIVLVLCSMLISNNLLEIGALVFIVTYLGRVTGNLFAINSIVRMIEQAFLDAAKVTDILSNDIEVSDTRDAKQLTIQSPDIKFGSVTFSYKDARNETVFNTLNLHIPASQSIGLVGKSGGGKSTLTQLLLRYMDIQKGEILIDDQNIAEVTQNSLRSQVSYVPQDPYLFHRSLRENITYGKEEASDEEIENAISKAHAKEFIDKLPDGLDTIVGERGVKLSGGQRQRVAIARAILKDAPILILDEATSALDSESEKLIQSALENLMEDKTAIVIAHRLSTVAKLDRIIVLDDGTIAEDGTHTELLKKRGTYAKLWNHQSGGFIAE